MIYWFVILSVGRLKSLLDVQVWFVVSISRLRASHDFFSQPVANLMAVPFIFFAVVISSRLKLERNISLRQR